ncbi:MAG TPA: 6,7-dimethyl-8-ribityllumazine synthase [Gaiellaceae bacterium]|nr:6,7-dimethyl-8-ribityllumazine synthase [Gaiellaceae bacterium]
MSPPPGEPPQPPPPAPPAPAVSPPPTPPPTSGPVPPPVSPPPEVESPPVGEDTDPSGESVVVDDPAAGDPFEGWPAAESAAVIEDSPVNGSSVEHVRGEVDVPDGYTVLEGTPLGKRRSVGIVVSRFNGGVTNRMLQGALEALVEAGVSQDAITVMPVPGAFELPLAAMALAKTRRYACIVALGAIVRGETPHFDYVASECASGLQLAGIETGVPVSFGVLTVDTVEQAEERIYKAAEAVRSALEMADLFARLRASATQ